MLLQYFLCLLATITTSVLSQYFESHITYVNENKNSAIKIVEAEDVYINNNIQQKLEKVELKIYYESLCFGCAMFDDYYLVPVVIKLGKYLDIYTNPYGNSKTIYHKNGTIEIKCDHGPKECYGNILHACALHLFNVTEAIIFNTCMMNPGGHQDGSDDVAADKCGKKLNIDSKAVKECANSPLGFKLILEYGEEMKNVHPDRVPYILINGKVEKEQYNLEKDICGAFASPPAECKTVTNWEQRETPQNVYRLMPTQSDVVRIDVYYESFCHGCRDDITKQLVPIVQHVPANLWDIHLYPYGNAKTIEYPNKTLNIMCQHGPAECYGNRLHACAIDALRNITTDVLYIGCMMNETGSEGGSDDEAAQVCGQAMDIKYKIIQDCAKSTRGMDLLKYYGEESKKIGFKWVPYILINGKPYDGTNFKQDFCNAFKQPPVYCYS